MSYRVLRVIGCKRRKGEEEAEYYFKSKLYTIDPSPYLNGRSHIDVYINPVDPTKYHMEVSFMPKRK